MTAYWHCFSGIVTREWLRAGRQAAGQVGSLQKLRCGALIIGCRDKEPVGRARLGERFRQRARVWPLR
ncbi:hypothetical protein B1218_31360 [Pseudomonas ogarae]|nr:hypothetical protein B1218_31360 [Pseudomonas ogarae]